MLAWTQAHGANDGPMVARGARRVRVGAILVGALAALVAPRAALAQARLARLDGAERSPAARVTHQDVALVGEVVGSITLRVVAATDDEVDRDLGTLATLAPAPTGTPARWRREAGAAIVETAFAVDVRQTGGSCATVTARLGEGSTDAGSVFLRGDGGPTIALEERPQRFATVLAPRALLPALLTLVIPDERPPGPLAVSALFEATGCSE